VIADAVSATEATANPRIQAPSSSTASRRVVRAVNQHHGGSVGRFLSQDRYESAAADQVLQAGPLTQNRYAFAGGNPVNHVEFDGHCTNPGDGPCPPRYGSPGFRHYHRTVPRQQRVLKAQDTSHHHVSEPVATGLSTAVETTQATAHAAVATLTAFQAAVNQGDTGLSAWASDGLKTAAGVAGTGLNATGDVLDWAADNTGLTNPYGYAILEFGGEFAHDAGTELQSRNLLRIGGVIVGVALPEIRGVSTLLRAAHGHSGHSGASAPYWAAAVEPQRGYRMGSLTSLRPTSRVAVRRSWATSRVTSRRRERRARATSTLATRGTSSRRPSERLRTNTSSTRSLALATACCCQRRRLRFGPGLHSRMRSST
jgi:hypothetical protein